MSDIPEAARVLAKKLRPKLVGTSDCTAAIFAAQEAGLESEDVEIALAEEGIELCRGCNWWFECGELVDPDGDDELTGFCEDCRKEEKSGG